MCALTDLRAELPPSHLYHTAKPYPTPDSPYRIGTGRFGTWDCGKRIVFGPSNGRVQRLFTWEPFDPPLPCSPEQWIDAVISKSEGER